MKIDNFFAELKRRNVYKVAVAYAVIGWLLVQVATQVADLKVISRPSASNNCARVRIRWA
jgi:hypothetical protein